MFTSLDHGSRKTQLWSRLAGIAVVGGFAVVGILIPLLHPQIPDAPVLAASEPEKKILATLDRMSRSGDHYANVPDKDGRLLRLMTEAIEAKKVVEIGTSTGVSGLWLCLALQRTGGRLTTFEIDPGRAATARKNFERAGVDPIVQVVEGDAHRNLKDVGTGIDLAFIDAEKDGYIDYLNELLPRMNGGGLILAHNVSMVPDYVAAVQKDPKLDTFYYMRGGGMAVTMKKR